MKRVTVYFLVWTGCAHPGVVVEAPTVEPDVSAWTEQVGSILTPARACVEQHPEPGATIVGVRTLRTGEAALLFRLAPNVQDLVQVLVADVPAVFPQVDRDSVRAAKLRKQPRDQGITVPRGPPQATRAHRAGLTTVILPKRNARDLDDVPEEIRNSMQFILVDRIEEAIEIGLTRSKNSAKAEYRPIDRNIHPLNEEISALDAQIRQNKNFCTE